MLHSISQSRRSLTRRMTLWLVAVGILACTLPTFRVFSAAPSEEKTQSESTDKADVSKGGGPQEPVQSDAPAKRTVPKESLRYAERSFDEWKQVLVTDLDPETRKKAIGALGAFGANGYGDEATLAIIEALHGEESASVASAASSALAKIGVPAVPALVESLKHERSLLRKSAARALASFYFSTPPKAKSAVPAIPALVEATRDEDPSVRSYACRALGFIMLTAQTPQSVKLVVPALSKALKDDEKTVRGAAAAALGKIGPRAASAVPALIEAIRTSFAKPSSPRRRGPMGVPTGRGLDRPGAIKALGEIGPAAEAAIPVLTELIDSHDSYRNLAATALERIQAKAPSPTKDGAPEEPSP